jgi:hypothetical protein
MWPLKASVLAALLVARALSAPVKVISTGIDGSLLYTVGNLTSPFYVPSTVKSAPVGTYSVAHTENELVIPFTVLVTNVSVITSDVLLKTLALYKEDDVYVEGFYDGE